MLIFKIITSRVLLVYTAFIKPVFVCSPWNIVTELQDRSKMTLICLYDVKYLWQLSINSSPPGAAHMCQWICWTLVQIMACRLFSANHYLNQHWVIVNWTPRNKLKRNLHQNTKLFIHENAFENTVCEMTAILSRGRWVNKYYKFKYINKYSAQHDDQKVYTIMNTIFAQCCM